MITQILLCGGSGTRLWPLSRKGFPKQFATILGGRSLFAASAERLSGPGFGRPVIVTGADFRFVVTEQLAEAGIDPAAILIEPEPRNTAPAILAAALHVAARDPEALMLVAPSDHAIADPAAFREAVMQGAPIARAGRIVTFGIAPTRAETGYGWLELEGAMEGPAVPLRRFIEKPDRAHAEEMLAAGHFLWNSGIFLFSAATILAAFEVHAPGLLEPVRGAVEAAVPDLGFLRLAPEPWARVEPISIDYAVMERASNLSVVPYAGSWNDLGGWDAVALEMGPDDRGVSLAGSATALDCHDTLLRSDSEGVEIVGIGLENIIAVAMKDAVLVADRNRAQDVKAAVEALKARGARQAENFLHDRRPWGFFETLALGDRFQVKRILVHPGAALSLQSHVHRSEHWIVVRGTARVTVDNEVRLVTENQSVYIPLGARHRMENPGKVAMELIEVQTGSYLGEDDITRYEDIYARGQGARG
ncbi:mannose-1-phosphate guanylyltransferase/mannose-6-phosphate isomerase (plasmid) [Cereibacter azotoformans]|uniref:mannose-1-phosphate guanylyltransferase/mannose-6-phosphate isomerase n=1 Tax=Cereibacter azotoformans TaxID=43057 RepID=UPI001EEA6BB8|nr:mannose-1-phosphate guanylyltransferase/mannose-6-phosphate isomerase [Cereibacter azotoformans]ULB12125.1 mannose-1-phosphate guanylyltransferase/mannose-6-phosphate isomerase [Cereibacter azotoformans]